MGIVYIDKLSIGSLLALAISRGGFARGFYFNASACGERTAKILKRMGIIKINLQPVSFCVADIRDIKGEYQAVRIEEDIRDVCLEIGEREVADSDFLKSFSPDLNFEKLRLYFEKIIAHEVRDMIVFVNAAKWHIRNLAAQPGGPAVFFVEKRLWSRYLAEYAGRAGIKAVEYPVFMPSAAFVYPGKVIRAVTRGLLRKAGLPRKEADEKIARAYLRVPIVKPSSRPIIANWYSGRPVTFDLNKRSDIFWALKSDVPRDRIMLYADRKDVFMEQGDLDAIRRNGVKIIFLQVPSAQGVSSAWQPTAYRRKIERYLYGKIFKNIFLSGILRMKRIPLFYIFKMASFIKDYSYWHDLFRFHNVKVNINPNIFTVEHIPQSAALEKCGGCAVSYQISNFWFSSITTSTCVDVMFLFSPSYQWIWRENHSLIGNYVSCGYITDYSFREVRPDAVKLREKLAGRGSKFVISFFDENSTNDRMSLIPDDRSVRIYKYILERVLGDETIGLIAKPGYPKTIYKRLLPIHDLIERAKAGGRCVFIDEGRYLTDKYASEAAQAADLCICLLLGGTVALETYLSNIPTVFLDLEGLHSHAVYQRGRGKVVFNDLEELFAAIKKFRTDPLSVPGFGDLSAWARDKDPFKDGKASLRMGHYLDWLLEKFDQGLTREEAVGHANRMYAQIWGADNVSGSAECFAMREESLV